MTQHPQQCLCTYCPADPRSRFTESMDDCGSVFTCKDCGEETRFNTKAAADIVDDALMSHVCKPRLRAVQNRELARAALESHYKAAAPADTGRREALMRTAAKYLSQFTEEDARDVLMLMTEGWPLERLAEMTRIIVVMAEKKGLTGGL